jgi:uncharacterized protein YndB with AHSA1/START domain
MTKISDKMSAISFDRSFRHPLGTVFAAFSSEARKAKWFTGPADATVRDRLVDCRTGGSEVLEVLWASGAVTRFEARYHHVDDASRIVYSYDLFIDGVLFSVSLADVTFAAEDDGTRVTFAESTCYFSDMDLGDMTESRLHGTRAQFDMLSMALDGEPVVSLIDDCH